jgi:bisphosphoglycerate-independent phosphoglycerate mutase (AlkP superfamily)
MKIPKPLILVILDGWGLGRRRNGNAIFRHTPPIITICWKITR